MAAAIPGKAVAYASDYVETVGGGRAYDAAHPYVQGEGPNDSVMGILKDPIVQRGLAFLGLFAVGAWLGGRF